MTDASSEEITGPVEGVAAPADEHLDTAAVVRNLGRRSVRAASAAATGQLLQFALTVGSVMILARLLTPADFGVFAMAMTVIAFTGVIRDLGLPMSTVFSKELTHPQISTLFWLNAGFGMLLAIAVVAIGPAVAWLYEEPRLIALFPLLATILLLHGFGAQHEALLKRQMHFGVVATVTTTATAAGVAASLTLALLGAGYWALAVHHPAEALVRSTFFWMACRWRPGKPRLGMGVRPMLRYGGDVTGYRVVTHLGKHLDRVLISIFAGAQSVGLYALADRWASMPQQLVYGRLGGVAVSTFSRLRDDTLRYRRYYRRAMRLLWTVMLPGLVGIGLEAEAVIYVLAGAQWTDAIPLLRILAAAALALGVSQTTKWMFLAEGRTRLQLYWATIAAMITAGGVLAGALLAGAYTEGPYWGVLGVAIGFSSATVLLAPITMTIWLRSSAVTSTDLLKAAWRPATATLLMIAAWLILPDWPQRHIWRLCLAVPVLATIYTAIWLLLPGGRAALREIINTLHALQRQETKQ